MEKQKVHVLAATKLLFAQKRLVLCWLFKGWPTRKSTTKIVKPSALGQPGGDKTDEFREDGNFQPVKCAAPALVTYAATLGVMFHQINPIGRGAGLNKKRTDFAQRKVVKEIDFL